MITNDKYCVYAHINKINGKIYIGQTCQSLNRRWRDGEGYKECTYFYNAIQKYGWNNFEHKVLATSLTVDEANDLESKLIRALNTMDAQYGYNLQSGGDNYIVSDMTKQRMKANKPDISGEKHPMYGKHHTEEAKKKISELTKGCNNPMYGKHHSEEVKQRLRELHQGSHLSEETKQKLSEMRKGENHPFYGKHHSEETRQKLSKAKIGKYRGKNSPHAKKIIQYDKQGNFIKTWDYISQIQEELGINRNCVGACCRGKYKSAGGFIWRYADNIATEDIAV